mmetsp:Transcript_22757/g.58027  ORF Transcript_22757/g.58027 Transcript_22757/m.58027 type:complete len:413 (+) Transcript_22757:42-1280(+)
MTGNIIAGLCFVLTSCACLTTNYLVMKRSKPGDGVFYCACMAAGTFTVGLLVNFTVACEDRPNFRFHAPPTFEPFAGLGGELWMLGTLLLPTVIALLGVGVGVAVGNSFDLLTGWAAARFGFFGVAAEPVGSALLNNLGVGLAVASVVVVAFIGRAEEPQDDASKAKRVADFQAVGPEPRLECQGDLEAPVPAEHQKSACSCNACSSARGAARLFDTPTITESTSSGSSPSELQSAPGGQVSTEASQPRRRFGGFGQAVGTGLAVLTGFLQWLMFDSASYLIQRTGQHSSNPMDYIFSLYCGCAVAGAAALVVYLAVIGRKSHVPVNLVLPGMLSGVLWGLGMVLWFEAGHKLSMVLVYPIMSTLMAISTMFLAFLHGKFSGRSNCGLAIFGTILRVVGVILITLSGVLEWA